MNQNSLFLILAAPACAWVAGMGLFKSLLVMAIMHRWVGNGSFTGPLEIFSSNGVFAAIVILAVIEIIMDIIPFMSIKWDRWTGHLRIAGAVVLTFLILSSQDVFSQIIMGMIGAALAITSYTAKASARRAAVQSKTGNIVGPVSSVTESCLIATTLLPLTQFPPLALLMLAFMLMAAMLVMYIVRAETRETLRWLFGIKSHSTT